MWISLSGFGRCIWNRPPTSPTVTGVVDASQSVEAVQAEVETMLASGWRAVDGPRLPWHREQWRQVQQRRSAAVCRTRCCWSVRPGWAGLVRPPAGASTVCEAPTAEESSAVNAGLPIVPGRQPSRLQFGAAARRNKVIKIDQVRELCAFLGYTARYGGYKIALLEPADRLNGSAANSLLKTLEEPLGACLLLVTAWPARLPATVRSRCQRLSLGYRRRHWPFPGWPRG